MSFNCGGLTVFVFFFFNDTATTEIYTLSLHDALPIWLLVAGYTSGLATGYVLGRHHAYGIARRRTRSRLLADRKSTRLNSSHSQISYAVFCLKKKTNTYTICSAPCVSTWLTSLASTRI